MSSHEHSHSQNQNESTAPPKILVVYAHPDADASVANKLLIETIADLSHVTIHDLYAEYPDFFIDVTKEHERILQHDIIVLQHPMFLYSCPSLMKEWMDRVLDKGFAFGPHSELKGKYWRNVITMGGNEEAFSPLGYNKYPLEQILQPFELTAALCKMHWIEPLTLYWARNISSAERIEHAQNYRRWLKSPELIAQPNEDSH